MPSLAERCHHCDAEVTAEAARCVDCKSVVCGHCAPCGNLWGTWGEEEGEAEPALVESEQRQCWEPRAPFTEDGSLWCRVVGKDGAEEWFELEDWLDLPEDVSQAAFFSAEWWWDPKLYALGTPGVRQVGGAPSRAEARRASPSRGRGVQVDCRIPVPRCAPIGASGIMGVTGAGGRRRGGPSLSGALASVERR